jgi:hypothetical protein
MEIRFYKKSSIYWLLSSRTLLSAVNNKYNHSWNVDIFLDCQEDSYMDWKSPCFMFILIMPYVKVHGGDKHAYSVLWYAPCDTHKQSYYGLYERDKSKGVTLHTMMV